MYKAIFSICLLLISTTFFCQTLTTTGQDSGVAGSYNSFYGYKSGTIATGGSNAFFGANTGILNIGGYHNTFIGVNTGKNNTIGKFNTFLGSNAGLKNIDGGHNTFIGYYSGADKTDGSSNVFLGNYSGRNNNGSKNVFLGYAAGVSGTEGSNNTAIGYFAGQYNLGNYNSFIGGYAGRYNTSGFKNVFLGYQTGYTNSEGFNNVFLGFQSGHKSTGSRNVFLGNAAGYNELGDDKLYIDNSGSATPLIYGDFAINKVDVNGSFTVSDTNTIATFRNKNKNGSDSGINIIAARNADTSGNTSYINLSNFDDNEGVDGTEYVMSRISAGMGDDSGQTGFLQFFTNDGALLNEQMRIDKNGNVGIATTDTKGFKLGVNGKIAAEEVKVALYANWPDYVFTKEYNLPTLKEVENHIQEKGHLQNIPSAKEVEEKEGFELGDMNLKLLEKIEELTLYTIQ